MRQLAVPVVSARWRATLLDLAALHQVGDHFVGQRLGVLRAGVEHQFGLGRGFVRIVDAGEALELAGAGLLVEALRVAGFADFDRGVDEDLDEVALASSSRGRRRDRGDRG